MADQDKPLSLDKPDMPPRERQRDKAIPEVLSPPLGESIAPAGSRPPEDGGVEQHPIHDSDVEDLGPEDFEEMADEVEKTGIKTGP
jgi:hypothetical protein